MGLLRAVAASVTPQPTAMQRARAHHEARARAGAARWLAVVLNHHEAVDAAFASVHHADSAEGQRSAQHRLAELLTGHALAEETVLYAAMARVDRRWYAHAAYGQQSEAKVQIAQLDELAPLSKAYLGQLRQLHAAVGAHVYEEERTWFPRLLQAGDAAWHARLSARYEQEFSRYMTGS